MYEDYLLISRPYYDERRGRWVPYARVSLEFHHHRLIDLGKTFETEEEATSFGFVAARAWIKAKMRVISANF
jgi:hypothetical protein